MSEARQTVETKLEVAALHVWFGDAHALRGVNLSIAAGRTLALVGASKSGKTTLLRCFNRLHDLVGSARLAGSVKIDGAQILGRAVDTAILRRRVGMIFSRPVLLASTIFDNVAFGLRAKGIREREVIEEKVERALRQALLWGAAEQRLHDPAASLPIEELQRLCLARVLALDPEVLLFDDPTATLDPVATLSFEEAMVPLRHDHTILVATNNLEQAARLSDATAYLASGEIIESGETPLIFSRPTDARTEDFLAGRASGA